MFIIIVNKNKSVTLPEIIKFNQLNGVIDKRFL